MKKKVFVILAMALVPFGAFAVDGVVLINQSTVTAAGGFPYRISLAGSYKLSGNLLVPSGVNGIQIAASNVTLDLNGFSITMVDGFNDNGNILVRTLGAVIGVTVRNGTISASNGFAALIDIRLFGAGNANVVEDLTLFNSNLIGGTPVSFGRSIVRRVSFQGGTINVTCPALVVDSLANVFVRDTTSSTACSFGHVSGSVL